MHKSFRKWTWFWLFELFFKNEAFNQKSETVHLLGYGWTCFHDSSGPRKLILRMPRPHSEAHENAGYEGMWASYTKLASGSQVVDFKKVVQNACINSKLGFEHSGGVAKWFGIDFEVIEWIWSIFMKIDFQSHLMVFYTLSGEIQGSFLLVGYIKLRTMINLIFNENKFKAFFKIHFSKTFKA